MAYFPMFVQLKKKKCLVIGGGKIALRKIEVLKDFEADITVIAPEMKHRFGRSIRFAESFERLWRKILMRQIL